MGVTDRETLGDALAASAVAALISRDAATGQSVTAGAPPAPGDAGTEAPPTNGWTPTCRRP